ncbi:DNA polymerase IV [Siminovitchia sp. 179-K 8D1 HS]|uniref:DNA polymerase IV n=1 Tax=Siminovitchia sp. 179-K 8D1 HS TaxID=3142385 RepID=UPI0039A3106D
MKTFYPKNGRVILHVDMNSFYASVEMAYDPSLKGKPLAIAGDAKQRKGIIVTCSYEARKHGVKATMPVWQAKKLCPHLIVRKPNFDRYRIVSKAMFDILRTFSRLVEPVSIDEGYIDITNGHELGSPVQIAEKVQTEIMKQLDLPCSIGIAPNKFLAKMASGMKKPLGITVLRKRDIPGVLWPLPVIEMHGIGEKTAEKLAAINIFTIKDLAHANDIQLQAAIGIQGIKLKERANGNDMRKVDPEAANVNKSIGSSITLPRDISNQEELLHVLKELADKVAGRLKRKAYVANNIAIMIRYNSWDTVTRSSMQAKPVSAAGDIYLAAKTLFIKHWSGQPVRLLGITGQEIIKADQAFEQLDLFSYKKEAKKEPLYDAIDEITKKYGPSSIRMGVDQAKKDS